MRRLPVAVRRRSTFVLVRRRVSVWFALGGGVVGVVAVVAGVLAPVLGLLGSTVGLIPGMSVPWFRMVVVMIAGYVISVGLLALILPVRSTLWGWLLAGAGITGALITSVSPLVVAAFSVSDGVGGVVAVIVGWLSRI